VRREAANRVTVDCWFQRRCGAFGVTWMGAGPADRPSALLLLRAVKRLRNTTTAEVSRALLRSTSPPPRSPIDAERMLRSRRGDEEEAELAACFRRALRPGSA
jgi:hypothetical protein